MLVVLPWPDHRLSPNARLHHMAKARVKAKARKDAAYITYDAMPMGAREVRSHFSGDGPIAYQVTFYPPDKRHRDDDNMIAMIKAARDGIADALGVNDRRFRPEYRFEEPCKPGRVEVRLSNLCTGTSTLRESVDSAIQKSGQESALTLDPGPTINDLYRRSE